MAGKAIDLTGQRFGRYIVLQRVIDTNKKGGTRWLCQCDCGNQKQVLGSHLRSGKIKSCGCLNRQLTSARNKIDLTGKRFGHLLVLKQVQQRTKDRNIKWLCQCDCGNQKIIDGHSLRKGTTQSCGCGMYQSRGEEKIKELLKLNNINFQQEKTFKTCKFSNTNKLARFDFYVDNKYIIEYDGQQHFNPRTSGWNIKEKVQEVQYRDSIKNQWCKDNNVPLIRIPYTQLNNLTIEDLKLETSKFLI